MSIITSAGHFVGEELITNEDLAQQFDTDFDLPQWIHEKTGIRQRRQSHLLPSEQGAQAGSMALNNSNGPVDFVLVNTFHGDYIMPQTATLIQKRLKLIDAFAFEINMPCAGPIYSLALADMMLKSGKYKRGLLVGVDGIRSAIDCTDYLMSAIFGDGAGAVVLEKSSNPTGIIDYYLGSSVESTNSEDFSLTMASAVFAPHSKSKNGRRVLQMKGRQVKRFIIEKLQESVQWLLANHLSSIDQLDYVVTHQANKIIIEQCLNEQGIPTEKILTTSENYGNTASASLYFTMSHHFEKFSIPGQKILFCGMGGGLTWGCIYYTT